MFAAETDPDRPVDRDLLNAWLERAERKAKLEKLRGGLWHPYRRKWASERRHLRLKDIAEAGGWNDHDTRLKRYTASDDEAILAVMSEPRKAREVSAPES